RVSAQSTWDRVSAIDFDWNETTHASLILEKPSGDKNSGDYFTRLRIRISKKKEFVLTDSTGLVNFRKETCRFHFDFCKKKNLINSNYILAMPVPNDSPIIFIFGGGAASSPGSLHVIELKRDGNPYELFQKEEFDLYDFKDLNGDRIPEIVGK